MKKQIKKIVKKFIDIFLRLLFFQRDTIIKVAKYVIYRSEGIKKRDFKKIKRPSVDEVCLELEQYDIISFDVFDTLIFRVFPDPKIIFDLWGCFFQIQYGREMRAKVERELRKEHDTKEISIDKIYDRLSVCSGIEKERGIHAEINLELSYCRPNYFMLEVFNRLIDMGKTVIILSDMYLPKCVIAKILESCGFDGYHGLYVSCEYGESKASKGLYKIVTDLYGGKNSFIQVGDNEESDINNAKQCGWSAYYYKNIHEIGRQFHPNGMSSLGGGLYCGIVNSFLYSGLSNAGKYYELGYVYFGLFAYGYCRWLNQVAKEKSADMILFAARDMYVVQQVYNECFGQVNNAYIPVSRLAVLRADFKKSSEMFFTCLHDAYTQAKSLTIGDYFTSIHFDFIFPLLNQYQLSTQSLIDDTTYQALRVLIIENKDYILEQLNQDHLAAAQYYSDLISKVGSVKTILFADMNGRCTSVLAVKHLLQDMGFSINVIGAQAYSISNKGFVEIKFSDNTLYTYLFSYLKNRNFYDAFRWNGIIRTRVIEAIFTEAKGTLHSYVRGSDGQMLYGTAPQERTTLDQIHQGIIDFAKEYHKYATRIDPNFWVSPFDAWLPVEQIIDEVPKQFPDLLSNMTLGN